MVDKQDITEIEDFEAELSSRYMRVSIGHCTKLQAETIMKFIRSVVYDGKVPKVNFEEFVL